MFYFTISTHDENGKNNAFVLRVSKSRNLLSVLSGIRGVDIVNCCNTKKEAVELAETWNEAYRNNGSYLFGNWNAAAYIMKA